MTLLILSAIIFLLLIFPIKLNLFAFFDLKNGKSYGSIYAYFLKITTVLVTVLGTDFFIKIGNGKAKKLKIIELIKNNNGFNLLTGGYVKEISLTVEYSSFDAFLPFLSATSFSVIKNTILPILKEKYSSLKTKANFFCNTFDEQLNLYLKTSIFINLLGILISLLKQFVKGNKK